MGTTEPIRDLQKLEQLKDYYQTMEPNMRNFLLIHMGVNTTFRISDLLSLTWNSVFDFSKKQFRTHITVIEQKTKKRNVVALTPATLAILENYKSSFSCVKKSAYLFYGRYPSSPLSRSQAFRIIKSASIKLNFENPVSCHSLRKTFGYHAWQAGVSSILLMDIYNHSDFRITKRYLGIEQDDKDSVFFHLQL